LVHLVVFPGDGDESVVRRESYRGGFGGQSERAKFCGGSEVQIFRVRSIPPLTMRRPSLDTASVMTLCVLMTAVCS
jgi:hypothetical protein